MQGYKNINFKIAFTGIMLSLVLLFQFLERYMPFGDTYIKINLSLIFVMATLYLTNLYWASLLLVLRLLIGPAIGSLGYSAPGMWAQFILFGFGLIYLISFCVFEIIVRKMLKIKTLSLRLLISSIFAIIATSLLGTFINAIFFTPGFWWIYGFIPNFSLKDSINIYENNPFLWIKYFGIKNYWAAMFTAYGVGNIIKYTIISIGFITLWRAIKHYAPSKYIDG